VFMEPFSRMWTGEENSNTEVNAFISALEEMAAKKDIAVYVAHHKRKGWNEDPLALQDLARGASALADAANYVEFVRPIAGGDQREIECTKNRYAQRPGPFTIEWRADDSGWYDLISEDKQAQRVIQALPPGGATLEEVAIALGTKNAPENLSRARRQLQTAIDKGLARVVKMGPASEWRWFAGAEDTSERPDY
jgi:hypothetical protein